VPVFGHELPVPEERQIIPFQSVERRINIPARVFIFCDVRPETMPPLAWPPSDIKQHLLDKPRRRLYTFALAILTTVVAPFWLWPGVTGRLFSSDFLPHIYCYMAKPSLVWTHVSADLLTGLAYMSISGTLAYLVYKGRSEIPFQWIFLAFGLFIVACGCTHFMDVLTVWIPVYILSGTVKVCTALVSVATAAILPSTVPKVLALVRAAKAAEQASAAKIEGLNEELASQNADLIVANKELDSFCHSVSHDLRTPLRTIDGFSMALLEDCQNRLEPEERVHLHQIRAATKHMAQLIDDMLTLSRTGRGEIELQWVDLSQMAREIAEHLKDLEPERRASFVICPGLIVRADGNLLRIVLDNLLSNAWKFTARTAETHIEVGECRQGGDRVHFVRDNGAGFDMEYGSKLFTPFQRLHDVRDFPGTGVGLATVHRIVQRLRGRVWAEGVVGKGATFYLALESMSEVRSSLGGQDGNTGRHDSVGGGQPWRRRPLPSISEEVRG